MRTKAYVLLTLMLAVSVTGFGDIILDHFDNDLSFENGPGVDAYWNPPPDPPFQMEIETQKVYEGAAALKVTWENKDMWPNFVIGKLELEGNAGSRFYDADSIRMAIAGPAGQIIMKLADADGYSTGDLASIATSGGEEYEIYEFPYLSNAEQTLVDLGGVSEIWLLVDAGKKGTSGTIYIDSIELIIGSGDNAEVVEVIDNFDNDASLAEDPSAPDSIPSGNSLLPGSFTTAVVDDPSGAANAVLKVDYNTSPWQVLWVDDLDVTDWSEATELSIDVYGTAGGILLKLKDINGDEEEPAGGTQRHDGNEWGTLYWDMTTVSSVDVTQIDRLIVFIEGPSGGQGTIYFDNLTLVGATNARDWSLY
ncbi:MAG: hypothetical protein JXR73_06365 [Candidatus Omnitrophica bacterium]|nr:hypothetical protein [Candidatus Omnitrophota bacterium]